MTGYSCEVKCTFIFSFPFPCYAEAYFPLRNSYVATVECIMTFYLFIYLFSVPSKAQFPEKGTVRSPERIEIHQEVSEIRRLYCAFIWNAF